MAGHDRHSYYVAPNAGKEAVAIDLKSAEGRAVLHRLVNRLEVDVFCTNTMPGRHAKLGIDHETLRALRPALVWCSISAMGLRYPDVPGYDPMLQALCGYMDLTGYRDGPPLQCGPPLIDLKAGDEVFAQTLLALLERAESGEGKIVDVSMAQAAVSWLHTFLPMLDMGSSAEELRRNGNEHRQFIPVNSYPVCDGHVLVAVGSDVQWRRLTAHPLFAALADERFATNEGRRAHRDELHAAIGAITEDHAREDVAEALAEAGIPHAPIVAIEDVWELDFVRSTALRTTAPDGRVVRLPPPAVATRHLEEIGGALPFAPRYGEHTDAVLSEAGYSGAEIRSLRETGAVA